MIDDPADLLREQARIDGMVDRSNADDAVPAFQMPPSVPGERRDAVSQPDAVAVEPLRKLQRSSSDFGVVRLVDRPLDRARHHGTLPVLDRGMVDDAMAQERPILHQAKHRHSSKFLASLGQRSPPAEAKVSNRVRRLEYPGVPGLEAARSRFQVCGGADTRAVACDYAVGRG